MLPSTVLALVLAASELTSMSPPSLRERLDGDAKSVAVHRDGGQRVVRFAASEPLFTVARELPSRDEKRIARDAWASLLEYDLALGSTREMYRSFHRLSGVSREKAFLIHYAAFLAQYRNALDFLAAIDRNGPLHTVLDEPVEELGVPRSAYAAYRLRYLNLARATELAALEAIHRSIGGAELPSLRAQIAADRTAILEHGKGRGELLTVKNALRITKSAGGDAFFPVQSGIAEWMGDTKVHRLNRSLVSQKQIAVMTGKLEPGDILLERREWYLSNVGLPGYWPHAALYIGTPAERRAYFTDEATSSWLKTNGADDFDALLRSRFADSYARHVTPEHGHPTRVIEAMSEGVVFTTMEHSADADAVAVLRPRLTKKEKAIAIARAFGYEGRPYDFNFDFVTDAALVCTELVFKCYEPSEGYRGLRLPVRDIAGRKAIPANEIAKLYDAEAGSGERQFDFVIFLDGVEREKRAVVADEGAFRSSWKRPKWHIVTK